MKGVLVGRRLVTPVKAWYRPWCKRPTFNDEYLPTFSRPNVTLVDTGGKGVERITEKGVVVNGVEYEVDCLILATGFEVSRATHTHQAELEIYGRSGVKLGERRPYDPDVAPPRSQGPERTSRTAC